MVSRVERGPIADWFWTIDRWLLAAFITLMGIGFMLSFAASPAVAERLGYDSFFFVRRHALFIAPALAVMISLSFCSPKMIRRIAIVMLIGALLAMVAALFIGTSNNGSRRWIVILGQSVQPSEFLKPAFAVVCAWLFAEHQRYPEIPGNLFASMIFIVSAVLLIAQPDFGQTVLLSIIWGGIFFMAGMSWIWIVGLGGASVAGVLAAYTWLPHVTSRIDRFLTGEGDNMQVELAAKAIQRGGLFGQGPGEGIVKRRLPDSHTDFVFSVAAEEFGILFCLFIVAIFAFIVLRGLMHAYRERDDFTRYAVAGLVLQFGMQSIINIGVALQLMPAKGMTLPLISAGGSSMVATCVGAGFILALTRHRPEKRARQDHYYEPGKPRGVAAE
ncbi:putative lipid II flippase FtsW [Martelella endophytica]|uniref:Probable peptidoglycan glycosyltransferase FtsW n=1 Tax=Martelella endophytica TaxID=1486262 RepID=A0A0D5LT65_MAREN|nr:putative lipid II flippase FtsW [Martelella endophytica]AJY47175.1 cell division protein FtsW [Martelella endophytica]